MVASLRKNPAFHENIRLITEIFPLFIFTVQVWILMSGKWHHRSGFPVYTGNPTWRSVRAPQTVVLIPPPAYNHHSHRSTSYILVGHRPAARYHLKILNYKNTVFFFSIFALSLFEHVRFYCQISQRHNTCSVTF